MKNKIIKIFGFVLIAQICLFACCDDEFNIFVTSFELTAEDIADEDASAVTNADFSLQFDPIYESQVASLISKQSIFMNTANATSCHETYTVIKRIDELTLTADVPLFGIEAGNSLNEHVVVKYQNDEDTLYTIDELLSQLNIGFAEFESGFVFDSEIPIDTSVIFTLTMIFENEEQLINSTTAVTFQ